MSSPLILASASLVRRQLLENAGLTFESVPARVDETAIKAGLIAEAAPPRDVADILAEMKARKVGAKRPDALVIGCDQVLSFEGEIFDKPVSVEDAKHQLRRLRGGRHQLLSAAVIWGEGKPLWRHVGVVRLQMRDFSDSYLEGYLERNWESIQHSVGGYKLEEEGVRLFSTVQGDYFHVLGLPLLEILGYLGLRGDIEQ